MALGPRQAPRCTPFARSRTNTRSSHTALPPLASLIAKRYVQTHARKRRDKRIQTDKNASTHTPDEHARSRWLLFPPHSVWGSACSCSCLTVRHSLAVISLTLSFPPFCIRFFCETEHFYFHWYSNDQYGSYILDSLLDPDIRPSGGHLTD